MNEEEKNVVNDVSENVDADTSDIMHQEEDVYSGISKRITAMEEAINRMSGVVSAMQAAQANVINSGSTIRETQDETDSVDDFVPLEKLDFTI